jgi:ADP-dependent NAD(P)H-hydrate dehydratase / NAD(P)H-hydrate epimerase
MRILTCSETETAASGPEASPAILMQRAGYAVAQFCASQFKFRSVCVVCGRGKKGGTGLIAAKALQPIAETVSVIILARAADELSADVAACLSGDIEPIWIADETDLAGRAAQQALDADLVIDAIIGTGFKPPLRGLAGAAVAAVNDAPGTIVAVDVPSGVDADSRAPVGATGGNMVFAHGVIALIAPKPAHVFGQLTAGPIAISEVGVQPAFVPGARGLDVLTGRDVGVTFPPLPNDGREVHLGHVLVIAGGPGEAGAAALTGMAALSAGAGRVTVACPKSIASTVAGFSPALVTCGLPETDEGTIAAAAGEQINFLLAGRDVVVLGPGLGRKRETAAFTRQLAESCTLPLVLDGDGLDGCAGDGLRIARAAAVRVLLVDAEQTARLIGTATADVAADRVETAPRISHAAGACVVLKGRRTVVAGTSGEAWINMSGNAVLAKAGMDSVLCGLIGAALARHRGDRTGAAESTQTSRPLHRRVLDDLHVAAAVHLHGLAADIARDALHDNVVTAPDLLEALVEAFRDCDLQIERNLFYLRK